MLKINDLSNVGKGKAILNRYHYSGSPEDKAIASFCKSNGIDHSFVELLWESFVTGKEPDQQEMMTYDISVILSYLKKTHEYYLDKLIPEIELLLLQFVQTTPTYRPIALHLLEAFKVYATELTDHMKEEEQHFFQFAEEMHLHGQSNIEYSSEQFMEEHQHSEYKITSMMRILAQEQHLSQLLPFKVIQAKLSLLQKDLWLHSWVEDFILAPKVDKMTRSI